MEGEQGKLSGKAVDARRDGHGSLSSPRPPSQGSNENASVVSDHNYCAMPDYSGHFSADQVDLVDTEVLSLLRLKHTSAVSALMAGFSLSALSQLDIQPTAPQWIMVGFGVVTALMVSLQMFALVVAILLLPAVTAHNKALKRHRRIITATIAPHREFREFIVLAWVLSTGLGVVLCLLQMIFGAWLLFWGHSQAAAIVMTVIFTLVLVLVMVFAHKFYSGAVRLQLATHRHALAQGIQHFMGHRDE